MPDTTPEQPTEPDEQLWDGIAEQLGASTRLPVTVASEWSGWWPRLMCRVGFHRPVGYETTRQGQYTNLKVCVYCGRVLFVISLPEDELSECTCAHDEDDD